MKQTGSNNEGRGEVATASREGKKGVGVRPGTELGKATWGVDVVSSFTWTRGFS